MAELTAADIMTRDVLTVTPNMPVHEVARLLATEHLSGVPVVEEGGRMVGIVTEGDLITVLAGGDRHTAWWLAMLAEGGELAPDYLKFLRAQRGTARSVMTTELVSIGEDARIPDIAALMVTKGVNRLPIVKDGQLVGIVTRADLVRALSIRPATEDVRAVIDETPIGRPSDRPVLGSDKLTTEGLPDRTPRRRAGHRPLFP
jgi:CBS domain-containing protein